MRKARAPFQARKINILFSHFKTDFLQRKFYKTSCLLPNVQLYTHTVFLPSFIIAVKYAVYKILCKIYLCEA